MHKIDIPQSIVDGCIARRGKAHVFDRIDPSKTAVLVIDMQNSWLEAGLSLLGSVCFYAARPPGRATG